MKQSSGRKTVGRMAFDDRDSASSASATADFPVSESDPSEEEEEEESEQKKARWYKLGLGRVSPGSEVMSRCNGVLDSERFRAMVEEREWEANALYNRDELYRTFNIWGIQRGIGLQN